MAESYRATREFAARGRRGYVKHCGPTAVTNLVLTLRPELADNAAHVFDEVVTIGQRSLAYVNLRATKHFGGTSDMFAVVFIRRVLRHFGCVGYHVQFGGPATAGRVRRALAQGDIVYLETHFHAKYHNHHLLLYGADRKGLRAADGWRAEAVWLSDSDLRGAFFIVVMPPRGKKV